MERLLEMRSVGTAAVLINATRPLSYICAVDHNNGHVALISRAKIRDSKLLYIEHIPTASSLPVFDECHHSTMLLHSKHTSSSTCSRGTLLLHLLADLDVDLEKFGYASVEAHAFALVQVGFAVVAWDAFLGT